MSKFEIGRKQYQAGMHNAKQDRYNCGIGYVNNRLKYGLQGASSAYYRGYCDYYTRYCLWGA